MSKNKEIPIWLKVETFLAIFFLIALTVSFFRTFDSDKLLFRGGLWQEYLILSSTVAIIWIISVLLYLITIRKK
jgi:hypothetical protein